MTKCLRCGRGLDSMGECPVCEGFPRTPLPNWVTRPTPTQTQPPPQAAYGWICPVCGRGNSPFVTVCDCKPLADGHCSVVYAPSSAPGDPFPSACGASLNPTNNACSSH